MANRTKFQQTTAERRKRSFSEEFKKAKVREIEQKVSSVSEISKEYEVTRTNIYKWLNKFGIEKKNGERVIVETDSDTRKLIECKRKIAELERIVGQKQLIIDFKDKMIEIAEELYHVDIKKKLESKVLSTTGTIEKS